MAQVFKFLILNSKLYIMGKSVVWSVFKDFGEVSGLVISNWFIKFASNVLITERGAKGRQLQQLQVDYGKRSIGKTITRAKH